MNPNSSKHFLYFRAIQGHSGGTLVDPTLQDVYCCRITSLSSSTTSGTLMTYTPLSRTDWFQEKKSLNRDRQSVFFTAVNPMYANQDLKEVQYQNFLESSPKIHYICAIWSSFKEKDCSSIKPDRSQSLFSTHYLRFVLRKWFSWRLERMETAKYINPQRYRALYSRQIRNMDVREPPNPEARKSTDRESEQSCRSLLEDTRRRHVEESQRGKYRETCRGNVDYRIPGIPHSTVQRADSRIARKS